MQESQWSAHCFNGSTAHASKTLIPLQYSRQTRIKIQSAGAVKWRRCVGKHLRFTTLNWRQEGRETPLVSVKVTAFVTFLFSSSKGSWYGLKSLQEDKGSFLQISLCTGTKSVHILKNCCCWCSLFYFIFFLLVLTYMWLWEKVYKR